MRSKDWDDVQRICAGDTERYQALIERHQSQIGRLMWRFSRDPRVHEELVQDVFVEAYCHLRSYRGHAPFEHWLSRIAVRVGYRFWRHQERRAREQGLTEEQWARIAEPSTDIEAWEAGELLHRLLQDLPPRDRLVLTFRYLEELDVAQTAQYLGWSQVLVRVQTLRARKKLETLIRENDL